MTQERKRASSIDVSGFAPRTDLTPGPDAGVVKQLIEETPFKSRADHTIKEKGKHGRAQRGPTSGIFARIPDEHYDRLHRIRSEKGWSLVTALERAIIALAEREGIE